MQEFETHRATYPLRKPNLERKQSEDELLQLKSDDGLLNWQTSPAAVPAEHLDSQVVPSDNRQLDQGKKYLWVIEKDAVTIALEDCNYAQQSLQRHRLSHTNLTGGREAHTGGELWFITANEIIMNGGSSRYAPRSAQELNSSAEAFSKTGYRVGNMGFDGDSPARLYRSGEIVWIENGR
ncbi:hypothetical protein [Burkholderia gladioli]|uniref:hypothetical protein n=1 Tax=Burkholderia gladioli TaxID=28095 RepID=UPI00163F4B6A|nr:hypothetical protein [Burkholderia gladioli]